MDQSKGAVQRVLAKPAGGRQQRRVNAGVKERMWPGTVMVIGIFTFIATFWSLGFLTFIHIGSLLRWFALFAFVGNLVPYMRSGLLLGMERLEWFFFNLLAVGPFVFASCLLLNFLVHGPKESILVHGGGHGVDMVNYWRERDTLPAHGSWPSDVATNAEHAAEARLIIGPGDVVVTMARGCLGYRVITSTADFEDLEFAVHRY